MAGMQAAGATMAGVQAVGAQAAGAVLGAAMSGMAVAVAIGPDVIAATSPAEDVVGDDLSV